MPLTRPYFLEMPPNSKTSRRKISKKLSPNQKAKSAYNLGDMKTHEEWIEFLKESKLYHRSMNILPGMDYRGQTKNGLPHGFGHLKTVKKRKRSDQTDKVKNEVDILYTGEFSKAEHHGKGIWTGIHDEIHPTHKVLAKDR